MQFGVLDRNYLQFSQNSPSTCTLEGTLFEAKILSALFILFLLSVPFQASVSVGVDCCNFDSAALLQICRNLLMLLTFMCLVRSEIRWLTLL